MPTQDLIPTLTLRRAFLEMMQMAGRPLQRIDETKEIYRLPDGKTMRLRTNNMPAVMAKVADGSADARLPFEGEDYVGIAFPAIGKPDTIVGYLVPSEVAAKAFHTAHRKWLAADTSRSRDNRARVLKFDGRPDLPWRGFEERWHEYLIGEIALDVLPTVSELPTVIAKSALDVAIAECKKRIALLAGTPVSAISISINF
jgi:hypothetical protein